MILRIITYIIGSILTIFIINLGILIYGPFLTVIIICSFILIWLVLVKLIYFIKKRIKEILKINRYIIILIIIFLYSIASIIIVLFKNDFDYSILGFAGLFICFIFIEGRNNKKEIIDKLKKQNNNSFTKASTIIRIKAFIIDFFILAVIQSISFILVLFYFYSIEGTQNIILNLIMVSIFVFIILFLKDSFSSGSPGKIIMKISVMYREKEKIPNSLILFLRNITFIIWPIEILVYFLNKKNRRIGDILFRTDVYQLKQSKNN